VGGSPNWGGLNDFQWWFSGSTKGGIKKTSSFRVRCLFGMQQGCNEYVMRTKDVVGWRTEMRIWSTVRNLDDSHSIQAADVEECSSRNGQEHAPAGCCHRGVPWKKNQGSRGWSTRGTEQPIGGEGLSVLLHSFFSAKARSAPFCGLPDQYSQRRKDREKCQGEPIASSAGPTVVSTVHFCVNLHAGPRALAHNWHNSLRKRLPGLFAGTLNSLIGGFSPCGKL
jgi:hypothetical protein